MDKILLFVVLLAFVIVVAALWRFRRDIVHGVKGGKRVVPITHLFELPEKVEYVDDITGEKTVHDTKKERYRAPNTDEQIRTVARNGTAADYGRLLQLMTKFHKGRKEDIARLLQRRDSEIYNELRRRFPRDNVDNTRRDAYQAESMYRRIREHVKSPTTYLDIGCNRGGITAALGRHLGAKHVLGADVIDWGGAFPTPGVEYSKIENGRLPQKTGTVDLVTANMTLHHIKDLEPMMGEICRVLKPGGHLFIKEHDCWNVMDAMLIDIEHLLYHKVGGDAGEYEMHHYTNYAGWDRLAAPLKYVRSDYFYPSLRNEMTPTRAYWAIYIKL